jgi:hypothetical protein
MLAQRLLSYRQRLTDNLFKEVVVWRLPRPLPGSQHPYKYRLALVHNGRCVLRYDNERGKGDHKHINDQERPLPFVTLPQLLTDFDRDIRSWRTAHADADH